MLDWSYFDKIYCITTKESYNRRTSCRIVAKEYNINICFKKVERHPNGSNHGCFESHIDIIREAKEQNLQRIIILEDDIIPQYLNEKVLNKITNFLQSNEWDLFYFGAVPDCRRDNAAVKVKDSFYRIRSLCTHAYAINRSAIEKFHDYQYIQIPIDYLYRDDLSLISYAHYPTQFYQETGVNAPQPFINAYLRMVEFYAYYCGISLCHPVLQLIVCTITYLVWKNISSTGRE